MGPGNALCPTAVVLEKNGRPAKGVNCTINKGLDSRLWHGGSVVILTSWEGNQRPSAAPRVALESDVTD